MSEAFGKTSSNPFPEMFNYFQKFSFLFRIFPEIFKNFQIFSKMFICTVWKNVCVVWQNLYGALQEPSWTLAFPGQRPSPRALLQGVLPVCVLDSSDGFSPPLENGREHACPVYP